MYNYFMLIGVIATDFEIREVGEGKKVVNFCLAVKREFQNKNGEYDTDFFYVSAWEFIAEAMAQYLKKGSKVSIKGRIAPKKQQIGETTVYTNELYADRIIFNDYGEGYKSFDRFGATASM